jgi:hypothetical protein
MADVTDTFAIKQLNEVIRPLCEDMRAIKARILALQNTWYAGLNNTIGTGSGLVQDNRQAEGVPALSQDQVTNAVAGLIGAAAAINDQVNGAPCVRTFTAG